MQIEWLKAFTLLKETMNFSDAAEEMYVSQSSFSKYIKALENHMGEKLIERGHRTFHYTKKGEEIYPFAKKIVLEYEQMMKIAKSSEFQEKQKITISVDADDNVLHYMRLILDFFEDYPEYVMDLREDDMARAVKAFSNNELDLLIGHINVLAPECPCEKIWLMEEELFYIGREEELNIIKEKVALQQIAGDRLILHQNMHREITKLMEYSGIIPENMRPIVTTTSWDVMKAYLQSGNARTVMTQTAADTLDPVHRLLRLPIEENPVLRLGILYHKDHLPEGVKNLLKYLKEHLSHA